MSEENLLTEEPEEKTVITKPEGLPDKFWNAETNEVRIDALLKSYLALEQKLSQKKTEPFDAPPSSADEYDIKMASEFLQADPEVNARLHAKGLTNAQVQEVYDLAAEKLVPMIMGVVQDTQADREIERLVDHFGGAEAWARVAKQLLAFGQKNLPPEMLKSLASSYEGVLTLHKMMNEGVSAGGKIKGGKSMSFRPDEKELGKMMRDPKYWRDRDPAFIAKVTEGFQDLYS